eukprot:7908630-Lingulodinium_polyedra.AAC.1
MCIRDRPNAVPTQSSGRALPGAPPKATGGAAGAGPACPTPSRPGGPVGMGVRHCVRPDRRA